MVKTEQQPPPRASTEICRRVDYIMVHLLADVRAELLTLPKDERSKATQLAAVLLLLDMDSEARAIFIAMVRSGIYFPART